MSPGDDLGSLPVESPYCEDEQYDLSDLPSNDCSRREIASFAALLPQCFLGPPMPLSELYEEAIGVSSFEEVLRLAAGEFELGNVQQRALIAAAVPGTRRLDHDVILENDKLFSADPLAFVRSLNELAAPRRLNTDRILQAFPFVKDFSEWDRLCSVAAGVEPPLTEDFVPSLHAATVRSSIKTIQSAIDVLVNVIVERQEGFVLSADVFRKVVTEHFLRGHISELWHVGKNDFDLGRLLYDYTNIRGATPINSPSLRPALIETFGKIVLPSVATLYVKAEELALVYPGYILHVRKSDVRRAYQRIVWSPETSLLMTLLLSDNYVIVPSSVGFGSMLGPYGYGPAQRLFEFVHKYFVSSMLIQNPITFEMIDSIGIIYVDDEVDVGPEHILVDLGNRMSNFIKVSLGDDAVNEAKDSISTKATTLGVLSDFEHKLAAPGFRAYLKLVYVFFKLLPLHLSSSTKVTLRLLQAIGQLAYRYSAYIPVVRSTASSFFSAIRGGKGTHRYLAQRQIDDIMLWRSVLRSALTHATILQAPFSAVISLSKEYRHLAYQRADAIGYSDASGREKGPNGSILPEAIGVFIPGVAWLFFEWPEDVVPIACIELLASIVAYLLVNFCLPAAKHCHLYIDNQNAISWSMGRITTNDTFARNLCCLNALLQGGFRGCFQSREYIRSQDNVIADAISRRRFPQELENTPRYRLGEQLKNFLLGLFKSSDMPPLQTLLEQHTMWDSDNSASFLRYQS